MPQEEEEEGCGARLHWNSLFPSPPQPTQLQQFTEVKRALESLLPVSGKPSTVYKLLEVSGEQFLRWLVGG